MVEWISSWSFFNWLAIIAFGLGLVGFVNGFFGLRDRFKNWKAEQNKNSFEKRRRELEVQLAIIASSRTNPPRFQLRVFDIISRATLFFFVAVFAFILAVFNMQSVGTAPSAILFGIAFGSQFMAITKAWKLARFINTARNPETVVYRAVELIKNAKKKGFISDPIAESEAKYFTEHSMFTDDEKHVISKVLKSTNLGL
jgi:hypothetical protein